MLSHEPAPPPRRSWVDGTALRYNITLVDTWNYGAMGRGPLGCSGGPLGCSYLLCWAAQAPPHGSMLPYPTAPPNCGMLSLNMTVTGGRQNVTGVVMAGAAPSCGSQHAPTAASPTCLHVAHDPACLRSRADCSTPLLSACQATAPTPTRSYARRALSSTTVLWTLAPASTARCTERSWPPPRSPLATGAIRSSRRTPSSGSMPRASAARRARSWCGSSTPRSRLGCRAFWPTPTSAAACGRAWRRTRRVASCGARPRCVRACVWVCARPLRSVLLRGECPGATAACSPCLVARPTPQVASDLVLSSWQLPRGLNDTITAAQARAGAGKARGPTIPHLLGLPSQPKPIPYVGAPPQAAGTPLCGQLLVSGQLGVVACDSAMPFVCKRKLKAWAGPPVTNFGNLPPSPPPPSPPPAGTPTPTWSVTRRGIIYLWYWDYRTQSDVRRGSRLGEARGVPAYI
jgi:hypothetical protein